jgi:hypothetical protein
MSAVSSISSLLNFLAAPIVVGDPEGHVIYLNPAFERTFSRPARESLGLPLAQLFEGGGREAILGAVAEVCGRGETVRFKLREGTGAWLGLASPIEADHNRVGVVILLTEEPAVDERLLAFQAEIGEPVEEAMHALDELLEQTGGRRSERYRALVERSISALERARKWNEELHRMLCGRGGEAAARASLDPARVVRQVVGRLSAELEGSAVRVRLLAPTQLPPARGDAAMLETALAKLIRHRAADPQQVGVITLSARACGEGEGATLVFSVVDRPRPVVAADDVDDDGPGDPEPRVVRATVSALGGRVRTLGHAGVGRVTAIELPAAPAS